MKFGSVIVLYQPNQAHVAFLVSQFQALRWPVVVVDNSPLLQAAPPLPNTTHIAFPENVGIAAAQNAGIKTLKAMGCEGCLLLDQDSLLATEQISVLASEFLRIRSLRDDVAAVGPQIFCQFEQKVLLGKRAQVPFPGCEYRLVPQIIASGMLMDISKLAQIGGKEESLFIDAVDHEWCWRAAKQGYVIAQTDKVVMHHRQGDARIKVAMVKFKVGAPIRLYYQVRNLILLLPRSYVPLTWKVRNLAALPLRFVVNTFFVSEGRSRFYYMLKGLVHGIRGKSGRFPKC